MFGEYFELHGQVKVVATVVIVLFLRYSALKEVEGLSTPSQEIYHKLYINEMSTHSENDYCNNGFVFNSSLENITIYKENSGKTQPCDCVIYSVSSEALWDIHIYNQTPSETFVEVIFSVTSCGPLHLNISHDALILKHYGADQQIFKTGLAAQIRIPPGQPQLNLRCSHNEFLNNTSWFVPGSVPCHVTTTQRSHEMTMPQTSHVTKSKANVMKQEMDNMPEIQTILLAVLIPVLIIGLVIVALLLWRRYHCNKGDGTVESDTIEVRTPKNKNAHLKLHDYENVSKPGIIEEQHDPPPVYDNVAMVNGGDIKPQDDSLLYAQVVNHITKSDTKGLGDMAF